MLRQTTVTVVEKVRPSKRMIRKKVRMEKAIALGINLAITVLSFALVVGGCVAAFMIACDMLEPLDNKFLILPVLTLAFMWGYGAGHVRCRKKYGVM